MIQCLIPSVHPPRGPEVRLVLRSLLPRDVPVMISLFTRATPRAQLIRSIYLAEGIETYLRTLAIHPDLQRMDQLWGLKDEEDRVVAAAHTRSLNGRSHLNQLAVDPGLQGQGLGTWMMDRWAELAQSQGASVQTLDVADANTGAQRLYARHGFRTVGTTHEFVRVAPPPDEGPGSALLLNWPAALASLERYGFGRFQVELEGELLDLDLTGQAFRTPCLDGRLLALLARLDPGRELLYRSPDPAAPGGWSPTGSILRLEKVIGSPGQDDRV